VSTLTNDGDWSHEERLILESRLVAATQGPLCLDPNPIPTLASTRIKQSKSLLTDHQLMRQAKKFSQVKQIHSFCVDVYFLYLIFKKFYLHKATMNITANVYYCINVYYLISGHSESKKKIRAISTTGRSNDTGYNAKIAYEKKIHHCLPTAFS
jgi:hypothetical protein